MNTSKRTTRISVSANFKSYGLGNITVGSSNGATLTGSNRTLTWTNTNGASGAYLSGSVCMGFFIAYVGFQATGTTHWNGTVRTTSTKWL